MKTLLLLACACLGGVSSVIADTVTMTFDQTKSLTGYAGFQWVGFNLENGATVTSNGVHNGMVSPNNVVRDTDGRAGQFSSISPFNLNSAYLTGAYHDGLNVEVQGFSGNTLVYDHTYSVNTSNATFVNLNYTGITEAKFIPSGGTPHPGYPNPVLDGTDFVMDNVTVTTNVPEGGVTALLLGTACVTLWVLRKRFAA